MTVGGCLVPSYLRLDWTDHQVSSRPGMEMYQQNAVINISVKLDKITRIYSWHGKLSSNYTLACGLTFAHLLVFPEGIANRARAFIGPERVHAAESTQQWILGTLIDV